MNRQRDWLDRGALDGVQTFFRQEPGVNNMLRWMDQRNLRGLQIDQLMSSAFIQMSPEIPRDIFVTMGKFIHDEVRHFRDFTRTINRPRGVRAFEGRVLRCMRTCASRMPERVGML